MDISQFQSLIKQGIPTELPAKQPYPAESNRAPRRQDILTATEKRLAIRNALRYFPTRWHEELALEFAQELNNCGRIYMHRFKPTYAIHARPIDWYPAKNTAGCLHHADDPE